MVVVKLSHEVAADAEARVRGLLDHVAAFDANFNGADLRVERDDYTCVEGADEIAGASLLQRVHAAIDNR